MDFLEHLPSRDSGNFSKFVHGLPKSYVAKNYIKVHLGGEDEVRPQEIITDNQSLLLRDLEREVQKQRRKALKRGSASKEDSLDPSKVPSKVPRRASDSSLTSMEAS